MTKGLPLQSDCCDLSLWKCTPATAVKENRCDLDPQHPQKQLSPELDAVHVPLPEVQGRIGSSGQHVTFGALGKR